ncbi:MAG: PEP-CTERM sorting domain-containing protein [Nostoc sp.]|uniref:PEP-CTERM sorting domain-containing protein n=1 Tax=Nostoc sp. TaxID=1180 RepID=UPI002FFA50A4
MAGTTFQGVVQDEFNLTKAFYTGTVTDPDTGKKYQGTFEVSGYGERYSNSNGNLTPTVFDFQSDVAGLPSVTSLTITNASLANLRIKVPINETSIPEPASLLGTLMVAGFGIVMKKRKDIGLRKTF